MKFRLSCNEDAKQSYDATKLNSTPCAGQFQAHLDLTSTFEYNRALCITALFGVFLETNSKISLDFKGLFRKQFH